MRRAEPRLPRYPRWRRGTRASRAPRWSADRGGISLELAIVAPVLVAFLLLVVAAGRIAGADSAVQSAAQAAARAASISRTDAEARAAGAAAAQATLAERGFSCPEPQIQITPNLGGPPPGWNDPPRRSTATVTCVVVIANIGPIGEWELGGNRVVQGHAESVIDRYRRSP